MTSPAEIIAKDHNSRYIDAFPVMKKSTFSKKEFTLMLSDQGMALFDPKKTNEISGYYEWISMKAFSVKNGKSFTLSFGKNNSAEFEVTTPSIPEKIIDLILDVIRRTCESSEIKAIHFEGVDQPRSKPSGFSPLTRFKVLCPKCPIDDFRQIKNVIQCSIGEFSTDNLPHFDDVIQPFLKTVPIMKYLEHLILSTDPSIDIFNRLEFLFNGDKNYLHHITINGEVTASFKGMIRSMKRNSKSPLMGVTFENSNFSQDHLQLIQDAHWSTLYLHDAINDSMALNYFYSQFVKSALFTGLICLNLDHTHNVNLQMLLPSCTNLQLLSLEDCGLQISNALPLICNSGLSKLRCLNLSSNICDGLVDPNLSLPGITKLFASNVTWGLKAFPSFLTLALTKSPLCFRLFVDDAHIPDQDWQNLDQMFANARTSQVLIELGWMRNRVSSTFLKFLSRCRQLSSIWLDGCDLSRSLSLLTKLQSVNDLHVTNANLFEFFPQFLDSIKYIENLKILDISSNNIGDQGINLLPQFLRDVPNLSILSFDNSNPTTLQTFQTFLSAIKANNSKTNISYSFNDVTNLKLKPSDEESLENSWREINIEFNVSQAHRKVPSFFDQPFYLFKYCPCPKFFTYLPEALVQSYRDLSPVKYPDHPDRFGQYDDSDEYEEEEEEEESTRAPVNRMSKRRSVNRAYDSTVDSDSDEPTHFRLTTIKRKTPVQKRIQNKRSLQPRSPGIRDDSGDDEESLPRRVSPKVHQKPPGKFREPEESEDLDILDSDDDEDDGDIRPPDWSFPLRLVPRPVDTPEIVDNLNQQYSVGALLKAVRSND